MAKEFAVKTKITLEDKISLAIKGAGANINKFAAGAKAAFRSIVPEANRLNDIIKGVTIGNLATKAVTTTVGLIRSNIGKAIEYQSSLIETQNVVNTVFGESTKYVNAWATSTAKKFGLTELQAKKFSGTFGSLLGGVGITGETQAGMSMKLSQVAGDLASFYNLNREDAFNKLMSGMRGQSEPLTAIGVNMSVKNMEEFAKSKGIKTAWKDMDQLNQTMLRFQYIISNPAIKNAIGDYTKLDENGNPLQSWAVSSQDAIAAIEQMRGRLVMGLMPTLIKAADMIKEYADRIGEWAVKNKEKIAEFFDEAVEGAKNLLKFARDFGPAILGAVVAFKTFRTVTGTIDKVREAFNKAELAIKAVESAQKAAGAAGVLANTSMATTATGAAGAFRTLTVAIGSSRLAMAGLIGLAVGGAILIYDALKKQEQKLADKEGVSLEGLHKARDLAYADVNRRNAEIRERQGQIAALSDPNRWYEDKREEALVQQSMKQNELWIREHPQIKYEDAYERRLAEIRATESKEKEDDPLKKEFDELNKRLEELLNGVNGTTDAVNGLKGGGKSKGLTYAQMGVSDIWDIIEAGAR